MKFAEGQPMPGIVSVGLGLPIRTINHDDVDLRIGQKTGYTRRVIERSKAGVETRHWVEVGKEATSDLAARALVEAMERGQISPSKFSDSALYLATTSPDNPGTSVAPLVQTKAGLPTNIIASTNADACPGFIHAFYRACTDLTSSFNENQTRPIAVIGAEIMSTVVGGDNKSVSKPEDPEDDKIRKESIAILIGDGAGAVIVKQVIPDKGAPTNWGWAFGSDGTYAKYLGVEDGGSRQPITATTFSEGRHLLRMHGQKISAKGVESMTDVANRALIAARISVEDIDFFVPHQANEQMMDSVAENLRIPIGKVIKTIRKYGNTSAAAIPMALYETVIRGIIRRNHIVLFCSFGAGVTYDAVVLPMVGLPKS